MPMSPLLKPSPTVAPRLASAVGVVLLVLTGVGAAAQIADNRPLRIKTLALLSTWLCYTTIVALMPWRAGGTSAVRSRVAVSGVVAAVASGLALLVADHVGLAPTTGGEILLVAVVPAIVMGVVRAAHRPDGQDPAALADPRHDGVRAPS